MPNSETINHVSSDTTSIVYATESDINHILDIISSTSGVEIDLEYVPTHHRTWRVTFERDGVSFEYYVDGQQYSRILAAYDLEISSTRDAINHSSSTSSLTEEEEKLLQEVIEEVHKEIPENSKSLLINESTSRFSSAIWYEKIKTKNITLAGVGGIGSFVGFLLARVSPNSIYLYDPDRVETANMSGQLYSRSDIGKFKTSALMDMIRSYTDTNSLFALNEPFTMASTPSDIMICGFDNMSSRMIFFQKWVEWVNSKPEEERKNCLFMDGRLAAEEFQIFCIRGDDEYNIKRYNDEYLFPDSVAERTLCSYKQTTFMADMIASYMVNLFVNFAANQCNPLIDRYMPFYTTYSAETMYLKTEA